VRGVSETGGSATREINKHVPSTVIPTEVRLAESSNRKALP
jgi:hypothetical protein